MKRASEDREGGLWADANALHDGTDYGQLAKLFAPRRQQGQFTAEPQRAQRTTMAGPLITTAEKLPLPDAQPLLSSSANSAFLRALCVKQLRRLEEKALRLLHWGLVSEKRAERRLARQIMRRWLRIDEGGEVVG